MYILGIYRVYEEERKTEETETSKFEMYVKIRHISLWVNYRTNMQVIFSYN